MGRLDASQADAWPLKSASDVPLQMYGNWAAGYFPALRDRIRRARLLCSGWVSGAAALGQAETVSVIMHLFRPQLEQFKEAVRSILNQSYEDWELILVDDGSASLDLSTQIQAFCQQDQRIRAISRPARGGTAAAFNDAVEIATGTMVTSLGQADRLVDVALEVMANAIMVGQHVAAYCDEDSIDAEGELVEPWLKTDFNPRLLLAQDCVGHLLVVRRDALTQIWPLEPDYDEVHSLALALGLTEALGNAAMHHVAEILYHRRGHAMRPLGPAAAAAAKACIAAHLQRRGLQANVHAVPGTACFELEWRLSQRPMVSVIVTGGRRSHDLVAFATALQGRTHYRRIEILLAGHNLGLGECGHALHEAPGTIRMLELAAASPPAALLNKAASIVRGDYLLFLHDTGLPRSANWLDVLLGEIHGEDRVAVVGCKHLALDNTIRGGAIALGIDGLATPMHAGLNATDPGYMCRAACAQDVSVVSLDGLLCRRDAFRNVGGFDEGVMDDILLAADLCRRLCAEGYRTIWTPAVLIDHTVPDERPLQIEVLHMEWTTADPAYNVNFARHGGTFQALNGKRLDPTGDINYNFPGKAGIVGRPRPPTRVMAGNAER